MSVSSSIYALETLQASDSNLIGYISAFKDALEMKDAVHITFIFFQTRQRVALLYFAADKNLLAYLIEILTGHFDLNKILFQFALDLVENDFADILFELLCLTRFSSEEMGFLLFQALEKKKTDLCLMILADGRWNPVSVTRYNFFRLAIVNGTVDDNRILAELLKHKFNLCQFNNSILHLALLHQNRWLCLRLMRNRRVLEMMGSTPQLPVVLIPEVAICTENAPRCKKDHMRAQFALAKEGGLIDMVMGFHSVGLPDLLFQELCVFALQPLANCISDFTLGTLLMRINLILKNVDGKE